MPQGDRRGNAYEFYDWTYDGEWKENQLVNGLGCLIDGDYGPENFKLSYYAKSKENPFATFSLSTKKLDIPLFARLKSLWWTFSAD